MKNGSVDEQLLAPVGSKDESQRLAVFTLQT